MKRCAILLIIYVLAAISISCEKQDEGDFGELYPKYDLTISIQTDKRPDFVRIQFSNGFSKKAPNVNEFDFLDIELRKSEGEDIIMDLVLIYGDGSFERILKKAVQFEVVDGDNTLILNSKYIKQ